MPSRRRSPSPPSPGAEEPVGPPPEALSAVDRDVDDAADAAELGTLDEEATIEEEEVVVDEELLAEEELGTEVVSMPAPRPVSRPTPGRPPGAKEEPEPPFFVGERVVLVRNTRPRTGTPIGDHPVGATGRVETVLSQTAIVRFDRAPETKEVVAFTCLESIDEEAKARRAERDRELARLAREAEAAADREREALAQAERRAREQAAREAQRAVGGARPAAERTAQQGGKATTAGKPTPTPGQRPSGSRSTATGPTSPPRSATATPKGRKGS